MVLRRVIATLGALCLALVGLAPSIASAASSSPYFNKVAQALRSSPVYVDPSASPTITATQASSLASQIQRTQHPIYLILVDNSQVGSIDPKNLPTAVHDALGGSEVIGVSSSKGFYANGFGLPASIANAAGPAAKQAVDQSLVPNDVFTNWVSAMGSLQVPVPTATPVRGNAAGSSRTSAPAAPAKHDDPFPWGTVLLVGLILVLLIAAAIVVVMVLQRRQGLQRVKRQTDQLRTEVNDTRTSYPDANFNSAYSALDSAEAAHRDGDLGSAEDFLRQARRNLNAIQSTAQAAQRPVQSDLYVEPTPRYASSAQAASTTTNPPEQQARPDSVARVQRPDGSTVIINNHTYMPQQNQMAGYGHYYGGGWYGGWYYGPGWYADPFWTYNLLAMDLALTELSLADRLNYDAGFRAGEAAAVQQAPVAEGASGGDVWNSGTPSGDPVVTGNPGGDVWNNSGSGGDNSRGDSWSQQSGDVQPDSEPEPPPADNGDVWNNSGSGDSGDSGEDNSGSGDSGGDW